jgi:protease IV
MRVLTIPTDIGTSYRTVNPCPGKFLSLLLFAWRVALPNVRLASAINGVRVMGGFFKGLGQLWKWVAIGVGSLVLMLLMVMILFGGYFGSKTVSVPNGSALRLTLNGPVVEQRAVTSPLDALQAGGNVMPQVVLRELVDSINQAATDKRIKVLTIEPGPFFAAMPGHLESIGDALKHFKKSGKPIIARSEYYTNSSYYLAAHADKILVDPMGGVGVTGFASYQPYLKGALDKFKVNVNIFKAGKYKSAVEPFSRSDMSTESRESTGAVLGALWENYKTDVEKLRAKQGLELQTAIDNMSSGITAANGNAAAYAITAKLADGMANRTQFTAEMVKRIGEGEDRDGLESFSQVDYEDYVATTHKKIAGTGDAVAVVYATGEIVDGDAPAGYAGGDSVARFIRKAAQDDSIKAIVLRVDSPGGSAVASEVIRIATVEAQARGKPVVVSMGSLAASGGYWISSTADEIFALPNTITGSIGVFGVVPTVDQALANYGVTTDGVGTTKLAGSETILRPLSDDVKNILQKSVEHTYREFLGRVSMGRKLPVTRVDEIAQGRVWDGGTAHQLKLVDRFGDLEDAIKSAAARAKLKSWRVTYLEEPESWQTQLLRMITGTAAHAKAPSLETILSFQKTQALQPLLQILSRRGISTLCLECTILRTQQ